MSVERRDPSGVRVWKKHLADESKREIMAEIVADFAKRESLRAELRWWVDFVFYGAMQAVIFTVAVCGVALVAKFVYYAFGCGG